MGDLPLGLDLLLRRSREVFPHKEIVTGSPGGLRRTTYGEWAGRVDRLAAALDGLGVGPDARVASLCWSTVEHLELYFAVPCSGRVLHTVNPRFAPEQIREVITEAGDEVVVVHRSLIGLLASIAPELPTVRHVVVVADAEGPLPELPGGPDVLDYEDLVASGRPTGELRIDDERRAAVICHTGGTTGLPKGIVYSHRSLVLHAIATTTAGGIGINEADVVLPIVPLFHANAVGFAHAAVGTGATLVLPGPDLSGPALAELIDTQRVSVTCGVPTVWTTVLPHLAGRDLPALRTVISGASAVPRALSERFRTEVGVPLTQIWGMTETSPLAIMVPTLASDRDDLDEDQLADLRASVGRPVLGVEARIVADDGAPVAADGATAGELQVRGPWVASGYLGGRSAESFTDDGWLRTGDLATVDASGIIRIVDRLKDVIKSGGEWISSIELENLLMAHPGVAEAAVVGVVDEQWGERPVACVVAAGDAAPSDDELRAHLDGHVPTWWFPDRFVVVEEIPKTSVGKFAKSVLRDRFEA